MNNDSLGDRMKQYEANAESTLIRRVPVIIRLDGKAFHTFTAKNFEKGYSATFTLLMIGVTQYLTTYYNLNYNNSIIN